jgi:ATP-dependent helicase/DNAse subunit B
VFCVPNVASVSGLSILDCPFGFFLTYIFAIKQKKKSRSINNACCII